MSWLGKTWNRIKKAANKVKEVIKDGIGYIKEKGAKFFNAITGKDKFDEAEALMNEITDRYDKAKFEYENEIGELSRQLEESIRTINYHKTDIYELHFKRFKRLGNRLHNLDIKGRSFLEYFDDSILEVKVLKGVRSTSELYKIDFNNLKFSEMALAVFTLGFYTRKKAKQTLIAVQEEEKRLDEEIEKMKTQIRKLHVVHESMSNVSTYFTFLIQSYVKLLERFEYGISTQTQKRILKGETLVNGKLDFKLMPIAHIEEFQALFNLSIVLKQMATMGYLNEDVEVKDEDIKVMNNIKLELDSRKILAA